MLAWSNTLERSWVCNAEAGALEEKGERFGNRFRVQKAALLLPVLLWQSPLCLFLLHPIFCLLPSLCSSRNVQSPPVTSALVVVLWAMEVEAGERGGLRRCLGLPSMALHRNVSPAIGSRENPLAATGVGRLACGESIVLSPPGETEKG